MKMLGRAGLNRSAFGLAPYMGVSHVQPDGDILRSDRQTDRQTDKQYRPTTDSRFCEYVVSIRPIHYLCIFINQTLV